MSELRRQVTYGARNLGRAVLGKPAVSSSSSGSSSRSSGGSSKGGRGGQLDPHSFKYWWYYGGGKPEYRHRRRNVALIVSGIGVVMFLGTWFGILSLGWGVLSVFLLGLMLAWVLFSNKMSVNPRKIIRKLSLNADHDFDDDIEHKIIFIEALIAGGFIPNEATPKDFVCFPLELDKPNPWKFKVRILFQRYDTKSVQSSIERLSLKIFNPDMPILDKKGNEVNRGAFCQRVVVEPDDKGRAEWFIIMLYFDQAQTGYEDISTPQEFRKFGRASSSEEVRGGRSMRSTSPGKQEHRPGKEGADIASDNSDPIEDFSEFENITNNEYGDPRSSAEKISSSRR